MKHKAVPLTLPRPPALSPMAPGSETLILSASSVLHRFVRRPGMIISPPPFFSSSPQVTLWNIFCVPFHFRRAQCGGSPEETNERAWGYGSVCLHASFFLISAAPVSTWAPAGQVMAVPAGASSTDGQRFISPSWWFMARQSGEKLVCVAPGRLS